MLGFSFGEIAIILLVALIVIGPKDLPVVLRNAGRMLAKAKKLAEELKAAFNEALLEDEVENTRQKVKKELRQIVDMDGNLQDAYDLEDFMHKKPKLLEDIEPKKEEK